MGHSGVNSLTRCNLFCHPRGTLYRVHVLPGQNFLHIMFTHELSQLALT